MSIILPTAPANFYVPTLETLKDDLLTVNGSTQGQITLLTDTPDDANLAWSRVGAGNSNIDPNNRGDLVAGQATIQVVVGPVPAYSETSEEFGYKLEFSKIADVIVKLQPLVTSAVIVGFAVIIGKDTFAEGTNNDVRYFGKLDMTVEDGQIFDLPAWDIIINYAEPVL